jgi:uncharacterized protein YndB with AHSA1/START domain
MSKLERSITINAPVEKVFDYINNQTHLPEIWPSLIEVTDMKPLPNGGWSNRWKYKMAGIHLSGTSEDIEHVANQRIVSKTKGGADSIQTWTFEPEDGGTKVTFAVEYTIPIPVLGKLAEAIIVKYHIAEIGYR